MDKKKVLEGAERFLRNCYKCQHCIDGACSDKGNPTGNLLVACLGGKVNDGYLLFHAAKSIIAFSERFRKPFGYSDKSSWKPYQDRILQKESCPGFLPRKK